jgi:hypothetical protein
MKAFLEKFGRVVRGVLSGFDRLVFRGSLRNLSYREGLQHYLWRTRVLHKDFKQHSLAVTRQLEEASLRYAQETGRPILYLDSHRRSMEAEAQKIAAQDHIRSGLICVFRKVDPCMSFEIHGNRTTKKLQITYRQRQCLHLYHYQIHPIFGFMHARIQTWFPFRIYVCINGHEWLARQMDQAGLRYQRRDNCFPWVEDLAQAQALFDQQLQANWASLLNEQAAALNPIHDTIFAHYPTSYYWSLTQSEWSSDVLFHSRADLLALYPRLVRHAITTYGASDILRFLGRKLGTQGRVPANFHGEAQSDVKEREEGVRIKHWLNGNTVKLYDKGSVLRPEVTIYNPREFRVYRPKEGDPEGEKSWQRMRSGVADIYRRAEVSQAANERYLEALAAVPDTTPLRTLVEPLCRPVVEPRPVRTQAVAPTKNLLEQDEAPAAQTQAQPKVAGETVADLPSTPPTQTSPAAPAVLNASAQSPRLVGLAKQTKQRRLRALNPLAVDDSNLLEAVSRPEFLLNGLRNRDVRRLLFPTESDSKAEDRRRSAAITRKLRLLRAHHLIKKVPKTHRYVVTSSGRKVITALLAARDANTDFLTTNAA